MSIIKVKSKKAKKGYTYKVTFKYKECGISRSYTKSGFITKKEAQEHENKVKAQIHQDGYLKKVCDKSLNQVYDEWLRIDKNKYAPNTIILYTRTYKRYVYNSIGNKKIVALKYKDIQGFINENETTYDICIAIKKVLNCVFKYAIRNEYIESNPASYVENTKTKEKKDINNYLTFEEYNTIINKLNNGTFQDKALSIAVSIGYHTGLRISEILALDKSDIDFTNKTITVNRQLLDRESTKENIRTKETLKTKESRKPLPLVPVLERILLEWFKINPYDKVVCDEDGYYLNPINSQSHVKKVASKLGINGFHFHMLRHTLITNCIESGVDIKTTQELARHSNSNTTLSIYTHIRQSRKNETLNNVFEQIYSKNTPKMNKENLVS